MGDADRPGAAPDAATRSPGDASAAEELQAEETQAAKRGFLFIAGAKVWFLVVGTVLNIGLPRLLGDPARFGDYRVVNTFISIINMVLITGVIQAVSKRISEAPAHAHEIRRRALRFQTFVAFGVFAVLVAGADLVAAYLFRDEALAELVRIAAFVPLFYGFYAVLIGTLNGLKRFAGQAAFDMLFATVKVALIVALVVLGFGVAGAFVGFAVAAGTVLVACFALTRRLGAAHEKPLAGEVRFAGFMFQVMGYQLMANVLLHGDVLVLKAAALEPVTNALTSAEGMSRLGVLAAATGLDVGQHVGALATESTAYLAGLYGATKNVAVISYMAVIAITFVIFPLISRATFQSDREATSAYVRATFRTALLLVAVVGTLIAAGGEPLLAFLFGDAYRLAAPSLLPLVGAMVCFALFFVMASILTAGGRPRDALVVGAVAAFLQIGLLLLVIPLANPDDELLTLSALVTLGASATALVAASSLAVRRFAVTLPGWSIVRIPVAAALALAAAHLVPLEGVVGIFVRVGAAGVVFLVVAAATREITGEDLRQIRGIFRR